MNKISVKHFIIFIFGVTYISLKTYPSLFIAQGGRDTWLYSLIIYLIFFAFVMYLISVMQSKKVYNINEIFTFGLSKFFGNIFLFLFALYVFISSSLSSNVRVLLLGSSITIFFSITRAS